MPDSRIDAATLRALHAQGLTPTQMARQTGIPRSTIRDRLDALGLTPNLGPPGGPRRGPRDRPTVVHNGTPEGHTGIPVEMLGELHELLAWWRSRRDVLQGHADPQEKPVRKTYFVAPQWIRAIDRLAELERLSITEVINQALAYYFTRRDT